MKIKYPKTKHLPFSKGLTRGDKVIESYESFIGKEIVVSIKMDGENSSIGRDFIYARSLDSVDHPSIHWLKGLWGSIKHDIPENWRICGEDLFAKHSIFYNDLPTYFMVFNQYILFTSKYFYYEIFFSENSATTKFFSL